MLTTRPSEPTFPGVRRAVKEMLFAVGYYGQRLAQLEFSGIPILCYHDVRESDEQSAPFNELHVTQRTLAGHCRLLSECCSPISLGDLRAARAGTRELPPRAVLVTFDDGYRGVLEYALPVLERYRVPAVVFMCTDPVLRGRHFWFDALCRRDGERAVLDARRAPFATWSGVVATSEDAAAPSDSHRPLTAAELLRLAASPLIEIGGHTMSHPTLALTPPDEQRREIAGCRKWLQDTLEAPIDSFAYPYGGPEIDYAPDTVRAVREAGFTLAFTTGQSFATLEGDPFQIPRFVMLDSVDDVELAHRLSHSWHGAGEPA